MNTNTLKKLQAIASIALTVAAIIFLFLCIFDYGGEWSLPAALGCSALSLLFQTAFKVRGDDFNTDAKASEGEKGNDTDKI